MKQIFVRLIQPGKTEILKEWGQLLMTKRRSEVLESLTEENVSHESAYIIHLPNSDLFVGIMESPGTILPANDEKLINQEHIGVLRECLNPPFDTEVLYTFDA